MPARRAARSVVGAVRTFESSENEMSPTLMPGGTLSAKVRIAARAASSRVGATSLAFIEIETSTTRTTVARSAVAASGTFGRATAMHSNTSVASRSPPMSWRFQLERPPIEARTSRFGNVTAARVGRFSIHR